MPVIENSSYKPPRFIFRNAHLQTIFPSLFRKVRGVSYTRERIATPDDDFIDLDWSEKSSDCCAIILHGLEGNSTRAYMLGMVKAMNRRGWDTVSYNMRGCSGEPNRQFIFYHSGATYDLETVVKHVESTGRYKKLSIIGFSLGGNVTLKYIGEHGKNLPASIRSAAAVSVPVDLESTSYKMALKSNAIYMKRFIKMLHEKIRAKMAQFPDKITDEGYNLIRDFSAYDNRYTAPVHGFRDAKDYWSKSSARQFLSGIAVPTLLINALDDPFLTDKCFPFEEASASSFLVLETPGHGGHVGFISSSKTGEYWHENRVSSFITSSEF